MLFKQQTQQIEQDQLEEREEAEEESSEDIAALKQIHLNEINKGKYYMSQILRNELANIRRLVLFKDRDWFGIVDGDEGSGKSVLAMQICKELDPYFGIDNIVWNAEEFINVIKKAKKGSAILLDEGYAAANARASLSEVNRSLVALSTEMRQKNLFVIICIPSIFDLDKHFAIHRSRALFHVYFNRKGDRGQFVIYPKSAKKYLYLMGKKNYSYAKPHSPYPAMRFLHYYCVDELAYREKKEQAFKKRTVSFRAKQWASQRDALMIELILRFNLAQDEVARIPLKYGVKGLTQQHISRILAKYASKARV